MRKFCGALRIDSIDRLVKFEMNWVGRKKFSAGKSTAFEVVCLLKALEIIDGKSLKFDSIVEISVLCIAGAVRPSPNNLSSGLEFIGFQFFLLL